MNEFIQQNLAEVGIKVEFEVVEWNTAHQHLARRREARPAARGATAINFTYFIQDPVHRLDPPRRMQPGPAERHQLGLLL